MPAPKDPIGHVVRNLFDLQRVGTAISQEASALIDELADDLAAEIARIDPTSPPQKTYRRLRLEKLLGSVDDLVGEKVTLIRKRIRQRLAELGAAEAAWAATMLDQALGSVAVDIQSGGVGINMMKAILDADPFRGDTLEGWTGRMAQATVNRVRTEVQLGMARGETMDDIVRRVRGKQQGWYRRDPKTGLFVPKGTRGAQLTPRFVDGVLDTTTNQAESIVRTAVNFISNRGHLETYGQNADILSALVVTATLDVRTTLICRNLDGERTSASDPDPRLVPPFHYRCRTVLLPVVDWEGLGIEPPPDGMRASKDGPVSATITQEEWLRGQPAADQDEMLGPTRAKLFREGKVSLSNLITEDRQVVPVSELLKKYGGGS